ncbi:MAG: hypothetical protein R3A12_15510 [Ignavibacteria bacterium]
MYLRKVMSMNDIYNYMVAVTGKHNIISTGEDALKAIQIVDAVYKSAKTGKEVIIK